MEGSAPSKDLHSGQLSATPVHHHALSMLIDVDDDVPSLHLKEP